MYMLKQLGSRNCVRCGKSLTDAASLSEGTGPICRKLDNKLLAQHIPPNIEAARKCIESISFDQFPEETVATWLKIEAALVDEAAVETSDWRKPVKQVEWLLSHPVKEPTRSYLMGVVFSLGYIGLVSLWKGEAATGEATCWFEAGRIYITGPQNKAARIAFKKVYGWKFHGYVPVEHNGQKVKAWSFPADKWELVQKAVWAHYPNFEGLNETVECAKGYQVDAAAHKSEQETTAAVVTVAQPKLNPASGAYAAISESGWLTIKTPKYKAAFVAAIKELPKGDRKWSYETMAWSVAPTCKDQALKLLTQAFPDADLSQVH